MGCDGDGVGQQSGSIRRPKAIDISSRRAWRRCEKGDGDGREEKGSGEVDAFRRLKQCRPFESLTERSSRGNALQQESGDVAM